MLKPDGQPLKVAIVHDWLVGGGAERVIQSLHEEFPDAPIYTSYCTDEWRQRLDNKVVTGFLQHWPFGKLRKFVGLLRIRWFGHLDFSGYDVVISSAGNGEAKGVHVPKDTLHLVYCHAPTHYYWRHYEQYLKSPGFGIFDPLARLGLKLLVGPLRKWDYRTAQRPDLFMANSRHTQTEIAFYYKREAVVVHPPIDIDRFTQATNTTRKGFLTVGRQTPYKRTDLIVEACTRLKLPLTVIGRGPEHERLVKMAGPTITFPEDVTDEQMNSYMHSAEAFLFAAYEDFGVAPVEALAAGTPVIAYHDGGALDYIVSGQTGAFFGEQTAESLMEAIQKFDSNSFDHDKITTYAQQFSPQVFAQKVNEVVAKALLK